MTEKNEGKIEKPWAVYGWDDGAWGIGKVVEDTPRSLYINYSERSSWPECWDSKWVKRFNSPIKAMGYFLNYQTNFEDLYSQGEILSLFLRNFPSERANLVKRLPNRFPSETLRMTGHTAKMMSILDEMRKVPLAQSQPKYTSPLSKYRFSDEKHA